VGQRDAAHGASALIILPAGADEIAAHNALDGQRLGLAHDHRAAAKLRLEGFQHSGKIGEVHGDEVILDELHFSKPERGELREHLAFARDGIRQDAVECRDAIGGDEKQVFAEVENLAHFSARDFANAGKIESEQIHDGCRMAEAPPVVEPVARRILRIAS
jgi:hypothetical protein